MIFNMVGGGTGGAGGGATLVVSSPANVSITVSKDDKSYTKNSGSLGSATFKGLATGTWTVTISGNGQTATRTIEITADYTITIAFFSASINITYPATSTCVVTNSSGQTVASDTNATSSAKTWTATVNAAGIYTVTATATDGSGKTKSATVSITATGQSASVELSYALVLFDGADNTAVTGGWVTMTSGGTFTISEGALVFTPAIGSSVRFLRTVNPVDFSKYKTLYIDCLAPQEDLPIRLYTRTDAPANASTYVASVVQPTTRGVVSIDLSAITTRNALYVGLGSKSLNDSSYYYNIYAEE